MSAQQNPQDKNTQGKPVEFGPKVERAMGWGFGIFSGAAAAWVLFSAAVISGADKEEPYNQNLRDRYYKAALQEQAQQQIDSFYRASVNSAVGKAFTDKAAGKIVVSTGATGPEIVIDPDTAQKTAETNAKARVTADKGVAWAMALMAAMIAAMAGKGSRDLFRQAKRKEQELAAAPRP